MDQDGWVATRIAKALDISSDETHTFPDALIKELHSLLLGALQEAKKPSELDEIATRIIAANRGLA
jgi:hypothetical protein